MAVTNTHFVEIDANAANDIALPKHYTHTLSTSDVQVPPKAMNPKITIAQDSYTRTWAFSDVVLTRAQHDALVALLITETTTSSVYPRLNVMDAYGAPNTWDVFTVDGLLTDTSNESEVVEQRKCTLTFRLRGTSGQHTFVVDSGGGNAVTLDLADLETVDQLITISGKNSTTEGTDSLSPKGPSPIACVVVGYAATTDLDKLQKVLDAKTAVEMVGDAFDTTGSGYYSTELTAGTTAVLEGIQSLSEVGAKVLVQLSIVRDTTP